MAFAAYLSGCAYDAIATYPDDDGGPEADGGLDAAMDASDAAMDADDGDGDADSEGGPDADTGPSEDAGPDGDAADPPNPLQVEPAFSFAPQWGDYASLPDVYALPTAACQPIDERHCVNGGLFRQVELEGVASCEGDAIAAQDNEGWLTWICEPIGDHVRVRSTGFAPAKGLRDAIDAEKLEIIENFVVIKRSGTEIARTDPELFWHAPIEAIPASGEGTFELDTGGTIYLIDSADVPMLRVTADKVSLVSRSSTPHATDASNTGALLATQGGQRRYVWIENISFDAGVLENPVALELAYSTVSSLRVSHPAASTGPATAVDLDIDGFETLISGLESVNAPNIGVRLAHATVLGATVRDAGGDCMVMSDLKYKDARDLDLQRCKGVGLDLAGPKVSALVGVRIASTGHQGVLISNADYLNMDDVYVTDAADDGIELGSSCVNVTLQDAVVANNRGHGVVFRGQDHRVLRTISASNDGDGLRLDVDNSVVMYTTTVHNTSSGISGGARSLFVGVVSAGNEAGLSFPTGADDNRVLRLFATDNTLNVADDGAGNTFEGAVTMGTATGAFVGRLPDNPQPYESLDEVGWVLEPRWQHWGRDDLFEATTARGPCGEGDNCSVWDWRVISAGPVSDWMGSSPFIDATDETHILEHTYATATPTAEACTDGLRGTIWNEATSECTVRFVDYAFEESDGLSAPDGLCWLDNWCTLYRNLGAYQGEGDYEVGSVGTSISFTSYPDKDFALSRRAINGVE